MTSQDPGEAPQPEAPAKGDKKKQRQDKKGPSAEVIAGVSVLGFVLLAQLVVALYVMFVIWPSVAAIPNTSIVSSSAAVQGTTTTSSTVPPSTTSSTSSTSTTSTTIPASATPSSPAGTSRPDVHWFGSTWTNPSPDTLYLVLVMTFAAIGALVYACTRLAWWVGVDEFSGSWTWWYLLYLPVGVGLAIIFYCAIRGGLLSVTTDTSSLSPYGIAALAAITGMFSRHASEKLREVFENLFGKVSDEANKDEGDTTPQGGADTKGS